MSRICFRIRYAACAFGPAAICLLTSCGVNGGDADTSVEVSTHPGVTGDQFLTTQSLLRQEQHNGRAPESVVGLLTLTQSRPVLAGNESTVEIQYLVNGLSSSVSSFQIEHADSGLPVEVSGCQVLTLQSLLDYGFVCQGEVPVDNSNSAIRIKLRLQNGRDAYSNSVTLPTS